MESTKREKERAVFFLRVLFLTLLSFYQKSTKQTKAITPFVAIVFDDCVVQQKHNYFDATNLMIIINDVADDDNDDDQLSRKRTL